MDALVVEETVVGDAKQRERAEVALGQVDRALHVVVDPRPGGVERLRLGAQVEVREPGQRPVVDELPEAPVGVLDDAADP